MTTDARRVLGYAHNGNATRTDQVFEILHASSLSCSEMGECRRFPYPASIAKASGGIDQSLEIRPLDDKVDQRKAAIDYCREFERRVLDICRVLRGRPTRPKKRYYRKI